MDKGIQTPWGDIWWAWVTLTTVGYDDIAPLSPAGRAVAELIIPMGIRLFSMITTSFAAFFISRQEEGIISSEEVLTEKITELWCTVQRLEHKLDKLIDAIK